MIAEHYRDVYSYTGLAVKVTQWFPEDIGIKRLYDCEVRYLNKRFNVSSFKRE